MQLSATYLVVSICCCCAAVVVNIALIDATTASFHYGRIPWALLPRGGGGGGGQHTSSDQVDQVPVRY